MKPTYMSANKGSLERMHGGRNTLGACCSRTFQLCQGISKTESVPVGKGEVKAFPVNPGPSRSSR